MENGRTCKYFYKKINKKPIYLYIKFFTEIFVLVLSKPTFTACEYRPSIAGDNLSWIQGTRGLMS
jgi:hypothetical protein